MMVLDRRQRLLRSALLSCWPGGCRLLWERRLPHFVPPFAPAYGLLSWPTWPEDHSECWGLSTGHDHWNDHCAFSWRRILSAM